ncbi:endoribonuclease YicC domain-containing protein, partial [Pseudomonas aeruginosa]
RVGHQYAGPGQHGERIERRRLADQGGYACGGGAAGRRLDFLMQELNREANTLGSKAFDPRSTQAAVNLKVLIEQMREQVQNIE